MEKNKPGKPGEITETPSNIAPFDNDEPDDAYLMTACSILSSERYQAFVENIGEGVYEVDIDGNFLYFNDSLCRIFGYPREEIQFQNFSKFMDAEHSERAFSAFNSTFRTGIGFADLLWKIIDQEGNERVIELSASLITNNKGKKIGFRGIVREITDKYRTQEALRKSEKRNRALLDFAPYPIVVFTLDGKVSYLNPAFTETFGWTFSELEGGNIPYVPQDREEETSETIRRLFEEKVILRHETKRLTKDGRILDVVMKAAVFSESQNGPSGELVILRDITKEKRIARNNDAMLRISMALPEYPDLEGLLDYVSNEVKFLLNTEGALVILLDEEKNELYFMGAAHEDTITEKRMKEVRFPASKGASGKVIMTGKPIIIPDTSVDTTYYSVVDRQTGFTTRSLLDVPLRSKDRIIGVLCAQNKKEGSFDETDIELMNMIAGTVALSIENATFSKDLQDAYREVSELNRAKDKVINHLSHELKTPLAVLSASLNILGRKLSELPSKSWQSTIDRAKRNLERILDMQYEVEDIMEDKHTEAHFIISHLFDQCVDELESLVAEELGEGGAVDRIKERIEEIFGPKDSIPQEIFLDQFVTNTIDEIKESFKGRQVEIVTDIRPSPAISLPFEVIRKVFVGLVKNAVENTPDEGEIEISVRKKGNEVELKVRDYGVGITEENQRRIFQGFFSTQETLDYSSKKPYEFNAGGKGADLLRMKIFSERYNFKINMISSRCGFIPNNNDLCPGKISRCEYCNEKEDCVVSGGTSFLVVFPVSN